MKKYFFLGIILLFSFLIYYPSLNFYFISDDFFYLTFRNFYDIWKFFPGFNHYSPVFWLFMAVSRKIFGLNPYPYHFTAIILHLLNTLIVYKISKVVLKSTKKSLIASFLFSLTFTGYEVVFWITGISTSLMSLFYLLSFLKFIYYLESGRRSHYLLFILLFILSLLTHELAVSLPLVCLIYLSFHGYKKLSDYSLLLIPSVSVAAVAVFKIFYIRSPLTVSRPGPARIAASVIKSFLYLFFPSPYLADSFSKGVVLVSFFFLVLVLVYLLKRSGQNKFILSWTFITVLLFSATSLPQARYLYLSSIPAFLLIASFLDTGKIKSDNLSIRNFSGQIFIFLIAVSAVIFLNQQKIFWQKSSQVTEENLKYVCEVITKSRPDKVFFIDLPDSINYSAWKAYTFRNGMENALNVFCPPVTYKITYFRTMRYVGNLREDAYISPEKLVLLRTKTAMIFLYDEKSGRVKVY